MFPDLPLTTANEALPPHLRSATGPAWAELAQLLECSSDGLVQTDERGCITYLNAAARALFGQTDEAPARRLHWRRALHAQAGRAQRQALLGALQGGLQQQGRWEGEMLLRDAQGRGHPCQVLVVAHAGDLDRGGSRRRRYSALLRDRSSERQASQQMQRQADILAAITEAIPATVVVVDGQGLYRFANQAFERYCKLPREQILGRRAIDVLGPEEVSRRKPFMMRAYGGEAVEFVLDYPGDQGTQWLALSCIPLKVGGVVDGFVGISQDVTREHRERARLTHLAERDPLTGLLNRAGFERSIELLMAGDGLASVALLYIDLDHFKPVNDNHGHLAGDHLLQQFAQRLLKSVRASDVVARLGGDEFAVLLGGMQGQEQALMVADKVLAAAREPFMIDEGLLRVSASVGVAMGLQPQAGWRELVGRADALLYRAKAAGRGRAAAAGDT